MALIDALKTECIAIGSDAGSKDEVLHQLANIATNNGVLAEVGEERVYQLLKAREEQGTTGFGGGIAIPHASLDSIDEFVIGMLVAPKGVEFDTLDGEPASILVFILGPSDRRNEHIRLLSSLSMILSREGVVRKLCSAESPEEVREMIMQYQEPKTAEVSQDRSMVFAFVQDEDCFHRIMQVFSAAVSGSVSVLDASNARAYLHRMPVFSAFWSDSSSGFQRIIIGIVDRKFSNDVVRRIHTAAGNSEQDNGLLVAIQELSYCWGNLDF